MPEVKDDLEAGEKFLDINVERDLTTKQPQRLTALHLSLFAFSSIVFSWLTYVNVQITITTWTVNGPAWMELITVIEQNFMAIMGTMMVFSPFITHRPSLVRPYLLSMTLLFAPSIYTIICIYNIQVRR